MEGSGKSTLLSGLAALLVSQGHDVVTTREPGGTALGNRLRAVFVDPETTIDALAEAFLVNASRAQHVADVIEPALAAGRIVLCDRFSAATLAYQGYGRGIARDDLRALACIATRGREPDLTFLVDVSVDVSHARVASRALAGGGAADRLEREGRAFHERVRDGYLELARDDARFVTLDGSLAPNDLVAAAAGALASKSLA